MTINITFCTNSNIHFPEKKKLNNKKHIESIYNNNNNRSNKVGKYIYTYTF